MVHPEQAESLQLSGIRKMILENWATIVARAIVAAGGRKSDIFHNAYGYGSVYRRAWSSLRSRKARRCDSYQFQGETQIRQITLINDFKPRGICGTPSYILNIAEKMEEMGMDPAE